MDNINNEFKKLINVMNDDLKDIEMLYNYCEESQKEGNTETSIMYFDLAKNRLQMMGKTYNETLLISKHIKL